MTDAQILVEIKTTIENYIGKPINTENVNSMVLQILKLLAKE